MKHSGCCGPVISPNGSRKSILQLIHKVAPRLLKCRIIISMTFAWPSLPELFTAGLGQRPQREPLWILSAGVLPVVQMMVSVQ